MSQQKIIEQGHDNECFHLWELLPLKMYVTDACSWKTMKINSVKIRALPTHFHNVISTAYWNFSLHIKIFEGKIKI